MQTGLVGWLRVGRLVVGLAVVLAIGGCNEPPPLDAKEYGEVLKSMPKIPGTEKPYPLPRLEQPATPGAEQASDSSTTPANGVGPVAK